MPLIEWIDDMSVGSEIMDNQHKQWIKIINDLDEAILSRKSIEGLTRIINEMESYVDYHFSEEERLMNDMNYTDLIAHKIIHRSFKEEVAKLKIDFLSGEIVLGRKVMKMLENWLTVHIMDEDKKYAYCFNNRANAI